eukprot:8051390-Pyramimonas_sp.AAC.1
MGSTFASEEAVRVLKSGGSNNWTALAACCPRSAAWRRSIAVEDLVCGVVPSLMLRRCWCRCVTSVRPCGLVFEHSDGN